MESLMDEAKNALLLRSREAKRLRVSATYDSEIGARAEAAGMYLRALHGQCDMLETNKTVIINSIREEFAQLQAHLTRHIDAVCEAMIERATQDLRGSSHETLQAAVSESASGCEWLERAHDSVSADMPMESGSDESEAGLNA